MSERRPSSIDWRTLRKHGIEDEIVSSGYRRSKPSAFEGIASLVMMVGYAIVLLPLIFIAAVIINALGVVFFLIFVGYLYGKTIRR